MGMGTVISTLARGLQPGGAAPDSLVLPFPNGRFTSSAAMSKDKDHKDAADPHHYDTRIVERNIKRGLISRKDYDKFLKSLPDQKDKVRPTGD
jgi:hypothetical protein